MSFSNFMVWLVMGFPVLNCGSLWPGKWLYVLPEVKRCGILLSWLLSGFEGKAANTEVLGDKLKFMVASWMLILPQFHGYLLDQIMNNWVLASCSFLGS